MKKSKIAYLILKNLYNGNILSNQELGLNDKEYAEILELMQNMDLIAEARITNLGQEGMIVNNQNVKITVAGINYLMENTIPDCEYKIRVSVDEILDGIELSEIVDANVTTCRYNKIFYKPLTDIDIKAESFLLAAEEIKREKAEAHSCPSNQGTYDR